MPPKSRTRRRRRTRNRSMVPPPRSSATTYNGPVALPFALSQNQTYNVNLCSTTSLVSSAGGVISAVISNSLSSMNENASFMAIYDEYRVLAMECTFIWNNNNTFSASLAQAPFITVIDRDSNGAISTVAAAFNFESAKLHSSGQNFKRTARMHSVEDAAFLTCTPGTTSTFYIKTYGTGFTVSTNYATIFTKFLVQFRGRL